MSAVFAIGAFSYSFLLIFAKHFGFKTSTIPILYLIFTLTASIFSLPFGKLADKTNRKFVMLLSYILWLMVCLSFVLFHNFVSIIITFILFGLHKAAFEPVQKTLVCELAPVDYRASCLGGVQMVVGFCALPASFIAGLLWDKIGVIAPFYISSILTIIAIILLLFVKENRHNL